MLHSLRRALVGAATIFASIFATPSVGFADSQPYVGDVMPVAFNFCPVGWAQARGDLLAIAGNELLFSLLGTIYGGDGRTTFGLPDLRGRHVFSYGQSPGLSFHSWGARSGQERVVLQRRNLPAHNHELNLVGQGTNVSNSPVGATIFERNAGEDNAFTDAATNLVPMNLNTIASAGSNQPVDIRSPVLAIYWCIATTGIFPSRN